MKKFGSLLTMAIILLMGEAIIDSKELIMVKQFLKKRINSATVESIYGTAVIVIALSIVVLVAFRLLHSATRNVTKTALSGFGTLPVRVLVGSILITIIGSTGLRLVNILRPMQYTITTFFLWIIIIGTVSGAVGSLKREHA